MNGDRFLLDTNAVLYILGGDKVLAELLDGERLMISIITEMELLSFPSITPKELVLLKKFIAELTIINITDKIKEKAIEIRKTTKLKLPDCIIAATSIIVEIPLVSADKQLKTLENLNLIYYEI